MALPLAVRWQSIRNDLEIPKRATVSAQALDINFFKPFAVYLGIGHLLEDRLDRTAVMVGTGDDPGVHPIRWARVSLKPQPVQLNHR